MPLTFLSYHSSGIPGGCGDNACGHGAFTGRDKTGTPGHLSGSMEGGDQAMQRPFLFSGYSLPRGSIVRASSKESEAVTTSLSQTQQEHS